MTYFQNRMTAEKLLFGCQQTQLARPKKMSLETGKSMGGIGAILLVVGSFVPFLSIVGIILVLLGMKNLADYYNESSIYQHALYGFIFGIIGIVAAAFIIIPLFFGGALLGGAGIIAAIGGIIIALVVAFIFLILEAVYYKRAFDLLAEKSKENMFHTSGLLLLIGAVLTIILVGFVLIFIAWILAAVAFFSIRTPATAGPPPSYSPPPAPPTT